MRIKFIKKLLMVTNFVLVVGIVAFAVRFFIAGGAQAKTTRKAEEILGEKNIPEANPDVKAQGPPPSLNYRFIHELPIAGDPPVEVKPVEDAAPTHRIAPLERDYSLMWTMNSEDPLFAFAHLEHKASKVIRGYMVGEVVPDDQKRNPNEPGPGWKLIKVEHDKAHFIREGTDEQATLEVHRPVAGPLVGDVGEFIDDPNITPRKAPPEARPLRLAVEIRPGYWDVPREEADWWGTWGEKVAEGVSVLPLRDPDTGRPAGLELKSVPEGSMLRKRGYESGDVLRSVNGVPVTSKAQAMAYLKGEGKGLTRYVVEFERRGKIMTQTYNVRQER